MQDLDEAKPLRHAMHVDVSVAREHVQARLAAALAAGGRIVHHWNAPRPGRSLTAPATACASARGPTVPPALVLRPRSRGEHPPLRRNNNCAAAGLGPQASQPDMPQSAATDWFRS
jgi:hypothetical protein